MGLITGLMEVLFGDRRNAVVEVAEVFRPNAEATDQRAATAQAAALAQFAAEFQQPGKGWFDRFIDGLNRVPRPAMALGVIGLVTASMIDPVWFAARMQGLALVPEPLWWLLGIIVSFYFGARHQAKGQQHEASIAGTFARTPQVIANIQALQELEDDPEGDPNPALDEWRRVAG